MSFFLSEEEKIFILAMAAALFLISVIVTICVVSPFCALHRYIFTGSGKKKEGEFDSSKNASNGVKPGKGSAAEQLLKPESKHFQLTVIPHYGTAAVAGPQPAASVTNGKVSSTSLLETASGNAASNVAIATANASTKQKSGSKKLRNAFGVGGLAGGHQLPPPLTNALLEPGLIKLLVNYEYVDEVSIKLAVCLFELKDLKLREYGLDPSCYVTIELLNSAKAVRRKSSVTGFGGGGGGKVLASFKSTTARRSLWPSFDETFVTEPLPRSVLKEGLLRVKAFDDERFANDFAIGEMLLPLKEVEAKNTIDKVIVYPLQTPKEVSCCSLLLPSLSSCSSFFSLFEQLKGEILVGYCFLPTSRRVTLTVFKANLTAASSLPTGAKRSELSHL